MSVYVVLRNGKVLKYNYGESITVVIVVCIGVAIFAGYQITEMWKANVKEEIRSSLQLQNQALLTANANSDCCPPARNGKLRQAARCMVLEDKSVVMYCRYE